MRAEYAVVGDVINLSARLMSSAHIGEIFCDETTYEDTKESIYFAGPHRISVKGKTDPVTVYCVQFENGVTRFDTGALVDGLHGLPYGCEHVIEVVPVFGEAATVQNDACSNSSSVGTSGSSARVLVVSGESGTGKTMLLRYFQAKYSRCFMGSGDSVNSCAPFHVWSGIAREMISCSVKNYRFRKRSSNMRRVHSQNTIGNPSSHNSTNIHQDYPHNSGHSGAHIQSSDEAPAFPMTTRQRVALLEYLVLDGRTTGEMLTVLNDLLPLDHLFQTDTSGIDDIEERTRILEDIIVTMIEVLCKRKPILLLFDNAQWMDHSSWRLLQRVLDQLPRVSALITIRSSRRVKHQPLYELILGKPYTQQRQLERLSHLATSLFLCRRYHIAVMDTQLLDFIFARTEGNPAQTVKLVELMVEATMIKVDKSGTVKILSDLDDLDMRAPRYIRARVMSCIDGLDSLAQMAVKLVSINPEPVEEKMLLGILGEFIDLQCNETNDDSNGIKCSKVLTVQQVNFGLAECENEAILTVNTNTKTYSFNSEEMRLVAYDTMLPSQRQLIHALYCQWISDILDPKHDDVGVSTSVKTHHQLAMLGYHLLRSGNAKSALDTYQKAAVHAIKAEDLAFAADCMQSSHKIMKSSNSKMFSHLEEIVLRSQIEFTQGIIAIELSEWDKAAAHMTLIIKLFEQKGKTSHQCPPSELNDIHSIFAPSIAIIPTNNIVHPLKLRNTDPKLRIQPKQHGLFYNRTTLNPLRCLPRFVAFRWHKFLSKNAKLVGRWKLGSETSGSRSMLHDAPGGRVVPEQEHVEILRQVRFYRKKAAQIIQIISRSRRKQEEMRNEIRKLTQDLRKTNGTLQTR